MVLNPRLLALKGGLHGLFPRLLQIHNGIGNPIDLLLDTGLDIAKSGRGRQWTADEE